MIDKKIAPRLRANENHKTYKKLMKLYDLAEELGIAIEFEAGVCYVLDKDLPKDHPTVFIEDIEGGSIYSFPPNFEFKLVFDNPKYLEAQRKEWEEADRKRKLEKEKELLAKEKAEMERKERERQAKEDAEKKLLAELKSKYEK